MSNKKREMVVLTDVSLITAIVQRGKADEIVKAAQEVGAQGASIHYSHGRGVRERLGVLGLVVEAEKETIQIIVSSDQANRVFESIYRAGDFDTPGMGIMWVTPVEKAATFIPEDILEKFGREDRRNPFDVRPTDA
ncbi:P-II family nitrogen regulator [Magnetovibrio sp. PR-2]|uniref:P-II family nitrogen regulator n=1 Tax=Magnetovibrio sp. PR-2 TaxID=3120356 RepID=UPI002FCE0413